MKVEYDSLIKIGTWILVSLPPHKQTIGFKWVFNIKENSYGSINMYKTRLVIKEFHQQRGFGFHETFSLAMKPTTIHISLTLARARAHTHKHKWKVQQIDINNAFLNDNLQKEVYMQQLPGFSNSITNMACKLKKATYG